ncbi:putative pre-mRNA 3' end processing protein [Encephalitozoon cuniculi]|nr:putative pre-mRNA 3' end processing protein [Encephalitozoon cuniculi]
MNEDGVNIKELISARFQNPKFVYDGKRMRVLQERKVVDYTSGICIQRVKRRLSPLQVNTSFDLSPQILNLKSPELCYNDISSLFTTKIEHVSVNKVKCPVNIVRWTPDGRRLMSGTATGEFTLWNGYGCNFETILQAHESPVRGMEWSPSGLFLISSDNFGIIKYWHPSMNNIQIIQGHTEAVRDLSFSHNDSKFCSASDDSTIKIWDSIEAKEESVLRGHNWDVRAAQWHKYKSLIASAGKDNLVKMWDPRTAEELCTLHHHKNTILALKWMGDENYLLTGGKDQVIKMVDIRTMTDVFTYKNHKKEVTSIGTHPCIPDIFVSGGTEGGIYFWQAYTQVPLEVIEGGHEGTVWSLDYHPVGHILASGSVDQSVRFWVRPRPDENNEPAVGGFVDEENDSDGGAIPGL